MIFVFIMYRIQKGRIEWRLLIIISLPFTIRIQTQAHTGCGRERVRLREKWEGHD